MQKQCNSASLLRVKVKVSILKINYYFPRIKINILRYKIGVLY
jgi:hypothetical protein